MKVNKEVVRAAMLAWNEISETLDDEPNVFETVAEFQPFYNKLLNTLLEEEEKE